MKPRPEPVVVASMHGVGCHGLSLSIAVFVDGKSKSSYVPTVSCDIATCHALRHLDLIINVCKKKAKGGEVTTNLATRLTNAILRPRPWLEKAEFSIVLTFSALSAM